MNENNANATISKEKRDGLLWVWGALSFGAIPLLFWAILPLLGKFELLDVALFLLLQPQGQLFSLIAGTPTKGSLSMLVAVLVYGSVGAGMGLYIDRTKIRRVAITILATLIGLQVALFVVACGLTALGVLKLT